MTTLIIDDSKAQRLVLKRYMSELGYSVTEASEGLEALRMLQGGARFSVMLVDWEMPGMNGLDFIKAVKADTALNSLPIIMVTSITSQDRMVQALQTGADEYLMKPVSRNDLAAKLEMLGIEDE